MHHLFKAGSNQSAQPNYICAILTRSSQNRLAGDHHAEIDHLVVVTSQDDTNDVLADIMHIAFHRRHHDLALRLYLLARC